MRIEVDCERIRQNSQAIVRLCAPYGVQVVGITKACCGDPDVARAMLAGGVAMLGESRLRNVRRLRAAGIDNDTMLLRLPSLSEVDDVVALTQVSLNSHVETVQALSRAAAARGVTHRVILMVETGDRREGVMPEDALEAARRMVGLPGIELVGLGSNLACLGGVLPTRENCHLLVRIAEDIERALGIHFGVISGGHTSNLALLGPGDLHRRVNQLRIGTAILLGRDEPPAQWPASCPYQDAFNVVAEVIEVCTKPSLPEGPIALDAFGRVPHWQDLGPRRRAIVALGEQDMRIDALHPKRPGVSIVGASSDHLVLDVTEADPSVRLGEELAFDPSYGAIATAMANTGVEQVILPARSGEARPDRVARG